MDDFLGLSASVVVAQDAAQHAASDVEQNLSKLPAPPGPYTLGIQLSYQQLGGNSETTTGAAAIDISKFWENGYGLVANGSVSHASSAAATHNESYTVNVYLTRRLSDNLGVVLIEEWRRDVFKKSRFQNVLGAALLWNAIDKKNWTLLIHSGPSWSREEFVNEDLDRDFAGAVLELHNSFPRISANTRGSLEITYYADFEDSDNFRLDSALELTTTISSVFSLSLAYDLSFDNQPATGAQKTDKTFTASLGIKLKGKSKSAATL